MAGDKAGISMIYQGLTGRAAYSCGGSASGNLCKNRFSCYLGR